VIGSHACICVPALKKLYCCEFKQKLDVTLLLASELNVLFMETETAGFGIFCS
jgi:hypothetical protein